MTKVELDGYQRLLVRLYERLTGDVSHLADEALHTEGGEPNNNLSNMPIHMADLGTDNYERENTLHLMANEEQMLSEIRAALDRITQGTFGRCEECQGDILPKSRLKELPYTRYCVACAKKLDTQRS